MCVIIFKLYIYFHTVYIIKLRNLKLDIKLKIVSGIYKNCLWACLACGNATLLLSGRTFNFVQAPRPRSLQNFKTLIRMQLHDCLFFSFFVHLLLQFSTATLHRTRFESKLKWSVFSKIFFLYPYRLYGGTALHCTLPMFILFHCDLVAAMHTHILSLYAHTKLLVLWVCECIVNL